MRLYLQFTDKETEDNQIVQSPIASIWWTLELNPDSYKTKAWLSSLHHTTFLYYIFFRDK